MTAKEHKRLGGALMESVFWLRSMALSAYVNYNQPSSNNDAFREVSTTPEDAVISAENAAEDTVGEYRLVKVRKIKVVRSLSD